MCPRPAAAFAPASMIKTAFVSGETLPDDGGSGGELYEQAADVQKGPLPDEDQAVFSARVDIVGGKLALSPEELAKSKTIYSKRHNPGGPRSPALLAMDSQATTKVIAQLGNSSVDHKRLEALNANAVHLASLLGTGPSAQDLGVGAPGIGQTGPGIAATNPSYIAALNAQAKSGKGLVTGAVPESDGVDVLHAMGDVAVAPAPTWKMRYNALFSDKATVSEDVRTVKAKAGSLELPADGHTGLASSQASLDDFVNWVKTVPDSELPNIGYGTLNEGEIGRYERNMIRKSAITINISVKEAEPEARAAVLFHELYHYWDVEVAKNHYSNVSYGFIDPAHIPEHELDAYYMTAVIWQQSKPDGASSPLAQFLGKLPTERAGVEAMVEKTLVATPQ
jgi:hypothetical protein